MEHRIVTLPSNGVQVCIAEEGEGEPLLFIHGLAMDLSCWDPCVRSLSKQYRCICIDLPGHGNSQKGLTYTLGSMAAAIEEVIRLLRIEKITLIGHSMGAQISMHIALGNPAFLSKLVLVAPAGFEQFSEGEKRSIIEYASRPNPDVLSDGQIQYLCSLNYADPHHPAIMKDVSHLKQLIASSGIQGYFNMMRECLTSMLNEPVYDQLGSLSVPVQVIFGDHDKLIPNRLLHPFLTTSGIASDGASRIRQSSLTILKRTGHLVQVESPEDFNQVLKNFLVNV